MICPTGKPNSWLSSTSSRANGLLPKPSPFTLHSKPSLSGDTTLCVTPVILHKVVSPDLGVQPRVWGYNPV